MAKASVIPIESLEKALRKRFPKAAISLDRPRKQSGIWYLDIAVDGHPVIVQWQDGSGFGVSSSPGHAYGEGADEVYPNEEATHGRVVSLLLSRSFTAPPEPVRLGELRKARGLSQAELAQILKKQQGEISKIERREDVLVSTLSDYVKSIGGELEIRARMADGMVQPLEFGDSSKKNSPKRKVAARQ